MILSEKITELRKKNGLSQEEFGTSPFAGEISKIWRRSGPPRMAYLHSVIRITIMKLWYLQIMIGPSSLWTVNGQALVKY